MGSIGANRNTASLIQRNEYGEIMFKFSGTDKSTGKRVVGLEISANSLEQAKKDIRANGYTISNNKLLPTKMFENVMNNTNAHDWDWEDAYKQAKKLLQNK